MNIKLRSALLFTAIVVILQLVSFSVIYALYADYKRDEFHDRLTQKAIATNRLLMDVKEIDQHLLRVIDRNTIHALYDEKVLIFDTSYRLIYSSIDDQSIKYSKELLTRIRHEKTIRFTHDEYDVVGVFIKENGKESIVLVSANDDFGKRKLRNLFYILLFSFIASAIITALISYFYAKQVFHPVDVLNAQINRITESRLNERVPGYKHGSELSQLANNFNKMLDRLEQAFIVQKSFIQHASHELRTPLANLIASCEAALNKELTNEQYRELIVSLNEEHRNLVTLTNALLLLSKYESIKDDVEWPDTRLDEVLFSTIETAQERYPAHHIHFDFSALPENDSALVVKANEVLLHTALLNLVTNACHYGTGGHIYIRLSSDEQQITITVSNTGPLIDDKEIPFLFHPFFRGENAAHKKGYGLGLAITQRIVTLHGGTINYTKNEAEQLSVFHITLPLKRI